MATLTPTLTLATSDATSDALSITVTDSLTVTNPAVNMARISLVGDAAATALLTDNATTTYVYLKNTDGTNHIKYFNDTDDGFGILWPGEFAFFAIIDNEGLKVQANNAACVLEYGYWTKG